MVKRPIKTAHIKDELEPSLKQGYQNACLGRPLAVNAFGGLLDYLDKRRPERSRLFDIKKPGLIYVKGGIVAERTNFGFVSYQERRRGPKKNVENVAEKICRLLTASTAPADLVLTPNKQIVVPVVSIDLLVDGSQFKIQAVINDKKVGNDMPAGLLYECTGAVRILRAPETPGLMTGDTGLAITFARGDVPLRHIELLGEAFSQAPPEVKPHELALGGLGYVHSQSC